MARCESLDGRAGPIPLAVRMTGASPAPASPPAAGFAIEAPYLLALNIPLRRHGGQHYADASWAKDLRAHLDAIATLTLFCPVSDGPPAPGERPIDHPRLRILGFEGRSKPRFLLALPATLARLWREVGQAGIVHTGVVGWPWPIGWPTSLFARLRGRPLAIVVESSAWRIAVGERAGPLRRASAQAWEALGRRCLAEADYAAYTQAGYRRSLPAPRAGGGVIAPATWIDEDDRLDAARAQALWAARDRAEPAVLFASRLRAEKGSRVVLAALRLLVDRGAPVRLDVIGEGTDRGLFQEAAAGWARSHMRLLDPVPYGPAFFALLDRYRAVAAPLLGHEQPRIVLDAAARAVATIGSDQPGVASLIAAGVTGMVPLAGDAVALADAIAGAGDPCWRTMGMAAHARSATLTHAAMHAARAADLARLIGPRPVQSRAA